jgi:hypothetical protein
MNTSVGKLRMRVYNDSYIPAPGRAKPMGSYKPPSPTKKAGEIKLGVRGNALISGQADGVLPGEWIMGESTMANFRHELGHHVHINILDTINNSLSREWNKIWNAHGDEFWEKAISRYGATNGKELFAESFATYVNPNYKTGMLPKDVEAYMKKLFGE